MMVLFDLDGTLVDSSAAILGAYKAAIGAVLGFDIEPDADHVHDLLRRRPIEYFRQHYPPLAETLASQYALHYRSDSVVSYDGVGALIAEVANRRPLGIVSNKGRARILSDLAHVGIKPTQFAVIVGAEDTPERKPHPAPILKALADANVVPSGVLYVGDGPHDMIAAKTAGLAAIGVTWGYYPAESLVAAGADSLAGDVVELATLLRDEVV